MKTQVMRKNKHTNEALHRCTSAIILYSPVFHINYVNLNTLVNI